MTSLLAPLRRARIHERLRAALGDEAIVRIQRRVARPFRCSMTALATIYWSDKAGRHKYTSHYERHLRHLRRRPIRLLEMGIGGYDSPTWGGASLRTWRDYFPRGKRSMALTSMRSEFKNPGSTFTKEISRTVCSSDLWGINMAPSI